MATRKCAMGKDSSTTSSTTQVWQEQAEYASRQCASECTSETWKYLALHLTDDPCCQAEAFFLQWTESLLKMYCSAVQNTPKQTTVYFATVLRIWHCHLLTILEATAYGYHSVQSTLSHTFYYRLNTCFNILILPQ